jgi:hypothetical protein
MKTTRFPSSHPYPPLKKFTKSFTINSTSLPVCHGSRYLIKMPVLYKLTDFSISESCNSTSKRKRTLAEISAALPIREELARALKPLQNPPREPRLNLPTGLNMESPYVLFSLFIGEDIFEKISESTNKYARRKRAKLDDAVSYEREWKDTNAEKIKVFFAILIYIEVHRSPQIDLY